ncbi:hypothetical protein FSB78_07010 [Sphingomonas ginsenosidivorax]|uniref:Uncharacterized protein n=1 Tax=Sphingomonas ginsenosidivorax TaxID=862135 RepID=A0A5C6UD91_9SPHN|nr:hypothetical protein [Sphingomonas ginsenosidivorax]TXC70713.1 hypothetical protein FSB78_07010 [Sphingomonas ginsenosidivorax]
MRWLVLALLLDGCGGPATSAADDSAGAQLEAAATRAGLVADPKGSIQGSWARDTDRLCVVESGSGASRIGVTVDYGEGQGCTASGTVSRSGDRLRVAFAGCRFEARFDGDRIRFPADLPTDCEKLCTGRASLAALSVDRLSDSRSEAGALRSAKGALLCGG